MAPWLRERWEGRKEVDEGLDARQGEYGWRLIQGIALSLLVIVVGPERPGVSRTSGSSDPGDSVTWRAARWPVG